MPLAVLRIKTLLPGACVLSPWEIPVSYTVIYYTPVVSDKEVERTYGLETILNHNSDLYTYCVYFCYLVYEIFHHNISHTGSINKRNRPACLWMEEKVLAFLTCCYKTTVIEVCSAIHRIYITPLIFHRSAHGNVHVLKNQKPLTRFVYMNPGIFGQMRSDVAPEWIKVKLFREEWWLNLDQFSQWSNQWKEKEFFFFSLFDLPRCLAPFNCISGEHFPQMV